MKLIYFVIALAITIIAVAQDDTDANIYGHVKCCGEHIPYANVFIKGTSIGCATDATGHYSLINVPEGDHILTVQVIGYKKQEKNVTVKANSSIEIKFNLEQDVMLTEQVVVSADRNEISRKEAPVIVNILSPKSLSIINAVCIAEGLDFVPGIRTECNCQNCGFSQVRMNGLAGPYSQILINSRPIFSSLAGVYGIDFFPPNMIQRIEIVRGGGSALFGGNAIAGTINILTKDPVNNSFEFGGSSSAIGIGHDHSNDIAYDNTIYYNGSLVSNDKKSGVFIYGQNRNRDSFDENGDNYTEIVQLRNITTGFRAFHKFNKKTKLEAEFMNIKELRRGGNKLHLLPHETDITEQLDHDVIGGSLNLDIFTSQAHSNKLAIYTSVQSIARQSYYGAEQDLNAYGETSDLTSVSGTQYTSHFDKFIFAASTLTVGAENTYSTLEDIKLGAMGQPNTTISNQSTNTAGLYAQNEWITGKFKLLLGFRYDNYSIVDNRSEYKDVTGNVVVPRTNLLYDINEDLQFRISYSAGYRAPQIFDEDLHIEASGSRSITHTNADNLIQENSNSISCSLNYIKKIGNVHAEFLVEGFYTLLDNPFANEFGEPDSLGNVEYIRVNAEDGAKVYGANFEINIAPKQDIRLQFGGTIQKNEYEKAQQWGEKEEHVSKEFMRTPESYGYATFNWDMTKQFTTSFNATYTGSMLVPHFGLNPNTTEPDEMAALANRDVIAGEELIKGQTFMNLGFQLAYSFNLSKEVKLQINGGLKNILNQTQNDHDRGIYRDAGYIYGPCQPRLIYFGLKIGNSPN